MLQTQNLPTYPTGDKFSLDQMNTASPCPASWEEMEGDGRSRFCGQCRKHVYNLSAMNRAEAQELIVNKEGQLCVRFFRRTDGRVLTSDCPKGKKPNHRLAWFLAAAIWAWLTFVLTLVANDDGRPSWLRRTEPFATVVNWLWPLPPVAVPAPQPTYDVMGKLVVRPDGQITSPLP